MIADWDKRNELRVVAYMISEIYYFEIINDRLM